MARTSVRRPSRPKGRRTLSGLVIAGVAVVIVFALVGVVSAGSFVANKVSSSSPPTATPQVVARQNQAAHIAILRAQAQATAIVRQAQAAGRSIVNVATTRANKQVKKMLAAARSRAQAAPTASAPLAVVPAQPTSVVAQPLATAVPVSGQSSTGTGSSASGGTTSATTPDLSGLPAAWKVVGYNASFGSGPGSAGSITVTNRSSGTFSGYARVLYTRGGSATAYFSGLTPGQTEVLALNGRGYGGGGYNIVVSPH